MKITQLNLVNFRAARGTVIDLNAPRVLISGINGSGKTSLREAIRWALRGLSEVTDQRGAGAEALAPHGTHEVAVKLTLNGLGDVSRLYSEHGGTAFSVEGFTGTAGTQQQALYGKLQTTPEFLDICLETDAFSRLHHADAKRLVLNLLNVKVPVDGKDRTLDELDVLYKAAFERRKDAKRHLQITTPQLTVPMPPQVHAGMERTQSSTPAELIGKIEERVAALQTEMGGVRQSVGETIGKRQALQAERTRLEAVRAKGYQDVEADEKHREELQQQIAHAGMANTPRYQPGVGTQVLRSRAEALAQHLPSAGCVLDAEVPCKTAQKFFTSRAKFLGEEIAVLSRKDAQAAPSDPLKTLHQEMVALSDRLKAAYQQKAAVDAAGGRLAEVDEDLSSLPETDTQEAAIAELEKRIANGAEFLRETQAYDTAVTVARAKDEARQVLVAEVAALETRVEQLGPKGLRVGALEAAMGAFVSTVNTYLAPWGWTVQFVVEPWTVLVNERSWETYSRSERYRIGIGIQFALAQMSGLSFALVDEADMLDMDNRRALAQMIAAAPLEQILMFATREPGQALPPPTADWIFVRLADSQVVESVTPKGAAA